jgi:hypothetical protein
MVAILVGTAISILLLRFLAIVIRLVQAFYWTGRYVNGVVSDYRVNRKLRRMIQKRIGGDAPIEVNGIMSYDSTGFYVQVMTGTGMLNVRISDSDAYKCCFKPNTSAGTESAIRGSVAVKSTLPNSQVIFRNGDSHIGYGVRAVVSGKHCVITARHVLDELRRAANPKMGSLKVEIPFLSSWEYVAVANRLDVAAVQIPEAVFSGLGIRNAKLVKTPAAGSVCRVYGSYMGEELYNSGVLLGFRNLLIKHSCTTYSGFSGAPLFNEKGAVFAIHTFGSPTGNTSVALDWMVGKLENEYEKEVFKEMEIDEDFIEMDARVGDFRGTLKVRQRCYDFSFRESFMGNNLTGSWADDDLEMDWSNSGFDDFGRVESGFQRSLPPAEGSEESVGFIYDTKQTKATKANNGKGLTPEQLEKRRESRKLARHRKKEKATSKKLEEPQSAPEGEKGNTHESQTGSTKPSQDLGNGCGLRPQTIPSSIPSTSTPGYTDKVKGPQSASLNSPVIPSSTPDSIPIHVIQIGVLPASWRGILNSAGFNCGKKRMWITDAEREVLEVALPAVHKRTLEIRAILAPNMQPKRLSIS